MMRASPVGGMVLVLAFGLAGAAFAQEPPKQTKSQASSTVPTPEAEPVETLPCSAEIKAQAESGSAFTTAMNRFNEENPPSNKPKPQVCSGGTVRWELTSWKMDIPEVTMKRQEWKVDVPETSLRQQEWWIKEPGVDCSDVKTGQYPQTRCEDTWIEVGFVKTKGPPDCTVTWHDIISRVCTPVLRDKRVVLGVPEFRMVTQTMSMDLPEVTMRTREFSLHLPAFYPDSGCIGEDCSEQCKSELNKQMESDNQARDSAIGPSKQALMSNTSAMFKCQADTLISARDLALAQHDKYITVADATLQAMRSVGLDEAASAQQDALEEARTKREEAKKKFDADIASLQASEKSVLNTLGPAARD